MLLTRQGPCYKTKTDLGLGGNMSTFCPVFGYIHSDGVGVDAVGELDYIGVFIDCGVCCLCNQGVSD